MTEAVIIGIVGLLFGMHGFFRPESGRLWGKVPDADDDLEKLKDDSIQFNRIVSVFIIFISTFILYLGIQ